MTIQFTLPAEYVTAARALITQLDPTNTSPTDADVLSYITSVLAAGITQFFPGVVLASQVSDIATIATATASVKAEALAALNVQAI